MIHSLGVVEEESEVQQDQFMDINGPKTTSADVVDKSELSGIEDEDINVERIWNTDW